MNIAKKMFRIIETMLMIFCYISKGIEWLYNRLLGNAGTSQIPLSVNYHFTRQCNYSCKFCFHTAKTSHVLPIKEVKRGLKLLSDAGMRKINFSGGEPFLYPKLLGEMVRFCKEELDLESVTIVSNGSKVNESWMLEYGYWLDILAVSCDSFRDETNHKIGRRGENKGITHLQSLKRVRDLCSEHGVRFKLNTVVNRYNFDEDMVEEIQSLKPCRWKVFQCLAIEAENIGPGALRQVEEFLITDEEWTHFLDRHSSVRELVPESNEMMRNSYLILDEYMRFLDNTGGSKVPSKSILDVGVEHALNKAGFDEAMFFNRGGRYKWSKEEGPLDW